MCEVKRKTMRAFGYDGYLQEQVAKAYERHEIDAVLNNNKITGYYGSK